MFSRLHLAVLVLVVVGATAQQPRDRSPEALRRLQQRRAQGDIDAIPSNIPLVKLTRDDITNFMNNPKSVQILTRCFVQPAKCPSASANNIKNQMNALTVAGGKCDTCSPEEDTWLEELMYLLVQGYTSQYPEQWQMIYPQVKVLVAAAARART